MVGEQALPRLLPPTGRELIEEEIPRSRLRLCTRLNVDSYALNLLVRYFAARLRRQPDDVRVARLDEGCEESLHRGRHLVVAERPREQLVERQGPDGVLDLHRLYRALRKRRIRDATRDAASEVRGHPGLDRRGPRTHSRSGTPLTTGARVLFPHFHVDAQQAERRERLPGLWRAVMRTHCPRLQDG